MIQQMLAIWSLVPLPFLKPAWTSGSSRFTYCWSLAWRILNITLPSMWDECNCAVVWAFFGIVFLWDRNENWSFPVLWPLLSFPNLLAYWVQHFHSIIFRIWNSWARIPSPPLVLFVLMLLKAHLTSHPRMSGSRWVEPPLLGTSPPSHIRAPVHPSSLCCVFCSVASGHDRLCRSRDCSPPGSSVCGILQARILEWVAMPFLQGMFPSHRSNPCLLCLLHCRRILYRWVIGKLHCPYPVAHNVH